MRVVTSLLCCVLLSLPHLAQGQETQPRNLETLLQPKPKMPVPDANMIKEAEDLVQEVFKADFEKARTAAQKEALAKQLLEKAAETANDPAGRFVLLRQAASLAAGVGNVDGVAQAFGELRKSFTVEVVPLWIGALETISKEARTAGQRKNATEVALTVIEEALSADDFESANKVGQIATVIARGSQDAGLIRDVASRVKSLKDIEKQFAIVAQSKKALEANPADPEANLVVGKYHCLLKGDWAGGAAMLVLGKDADLRKAAELDLANPATAESQVAAGDAWWNLAANAKEPENTSIRLRAAFWYRAASPSLSGLAKAKVAKRLEEVAGSADGPRKASEGAVDPFRMNSVWVSDSPKRTLTVTERKGETFRARFQIGDSTMRDVVGTIKGDRLSWLAKDVQAVKGDGPGGDNHGTIVIESSGKVRIDFVHGLGKTSGTFTLMLVGPAPGERPEPARPEPSIPTFVRPEPHKPLEGKRPLQAGVANALQGLTQQHFGRGSWEVRKDGLYNRGLDDDILFLAVVPPREYDFEVKATRMDNSLNYLCFSVPFGNKGLWLVYDWDLNRSVVDQVGKPTKHEKSVLPTGVEKTLLVQVRSESVVCYVDGVELFRADAKPEDAKVGVPVFQGRPTIEIRSFHKSQWKVTSAVLRPVKE